MLKESAEVLMEDSYRITVTEKYRDYLFRTKQRKRSYEIQALNMYTMIRISKEVLTVDSDVINSTLINAGMRALNKSGESMINIVAYAILNSTEKPSKELIRQIGLMTADDILRIVQVILKQMNLKAFMTSIISISGVNILEMNPKEQGS